ncbi:Folylpolyglutamate synthase [Commensalibacter sp. Nvir]|uniref:bifunctional folylpolyglutamate synthase/dihydrofolate synthase n=1 Tax=Commensalibacter sp. Nvir TaxID=3069817 RepID=UPI002D607DAE|nr:Folylpolyglutamate synthase [Commensalibacter sp. Nvir]
MSASTPLTEFTGRPKQILERLNALYPSLIDLSLNRLKRLLGDLGNPEKKIPPIVHVAGTNGKGSTCSFLRAIGEHAGLKAHVYTSPHLVNLNERFRIAGTLAEDQLLIETLREIERVNQKQPITVFEVLTAAAFLLFSRQPADLTILEVGLGGQFDATNVITPIVSVITSISMDHEDFLGKDLSKIAYEKSGIIKESVPVVTDQQQPEALHILNERACFLKTTCKVRNKEWFIKKNKDHLFYSDDWGTLTLPLPSLIGDHQINNAGLAIAALRHSNLDLPNQSYHGVSKAKWPARLQRLNGFLTRFSPEKSELWLDGGHNPDAGQILASIIEKNWQDKPLHLIVGMKTTKNVREFLAPLIPLVDSIQAVIEPDQYLAMSIQDIVEASNNFATAGTTVKSALMKLKMNVFKPTRILICGSLYLAGSVLKQDGWQNI